MPLTLPSPPTHPQPALLPSTETACIWVQQAAITLALFLGVTNLSAWIVPSVFEFAAERSILVMRLNTALAISSASLSLLCWIGAAPGSTRARIAQAFGSLTALIGGITGTQDLFGVNLGIDELLVSGKARHDLAGPLVVNPGRMSLNAALALFFLGLALVRLDRPMASGKGRLLSSSTLALLALLPAALGFVGYVLGVGAFTGMLKSTNILLHTAVAIFVLALGVLAARPQIPPVSHIFSTGPDGLLLRWTLPGMLTLLFGLGWLIGRGRAAGWIATGEGTAFMLYGGLVLLFILLTAASGALARKDEQARRAETAFQQGQERNRAIIDTALDGVLLIDAAGQIADANPAAERIFGWSRMELIGHPFFGRIIPERLRANYGIYLSQPGRAVEPKVRLEMPALRQNQTEFPIEMSLNALPSGGLSFSVAFIRDITSRQAAEENLRSAKEAAESASRAKDNFLAALSHELRTPLAPVLLTAPELRKDLRLPKDVRDEIAMIERNIALEARLIDDLLDLTRITRGKLPLRTERCDAHSLLSHAVDIVRADAQAKDVTITYDLAARQFGLTGDPARLQQVFWNLLKNAVKFTPNGGSVLVKTLDASQDDRLILEISDTGLGFAPDFADRIFQPFEQAGRAGDHRFGGLGLGLAIARAIVDLHGGKIRAGSAGPGLGATFTVELPGATEPPPGVHLEADQLQVKRDGQERQRILVVEDHEPTLTVLSRLLARAGHHVVTANSVAAALLVAEGARFETLISDLGLPDGSGLELIAQLRAREPRLRAIALSGYGMEEDVARSRAAGFSAHLVKPVDFEQLKRALRELDPVA